MDTTTYRVIGICGGRESVLARGLTRSEAAAKQAGFQARPIRGIRYCIESEKAAQQWGDWLAQASVPHLPQR